MTERLSFARFQSQHFHAYQAWFQHPSLQRWLEGIDAEWLAYILHAPGQEEWVVFCEGEFVGEFGLTLPTNDHPYYVLNNLAVTPSFRGQGLGPRILHQLTAVHYPHSCWRAYIHPDNKQAQNCFSLAGWTQGEAGNAELLPYLNGS